MPLPFLSPGDVAASGLPGDVRHRDQPARRRGVGAAHVAAPGPAQGRRLQRVAPPPRRRACSRSARCSAARSPAPQLPDEREHLGVALAGDDAIGAVEAWQVLADVAGPSTATASSRSPWPGCTRPDRPRSWRGAGRHRRRDRRRGRDRPDGARPLRHRRAGRLARGRPRPPARPAPRRPRLPPDQPLPVERHRPRLRGRRRPRRPRPSSARSPRRRVRCWPTVRLFDVYRGAGRRRRPPQPGLPAAPAGRTTAPSPTPTSPICAPGSSPPSPTSTPPSCAGSDPGRAPVVSWPPGSGAVR